MRVKKNMHREEKIAEVFSRYGGVMRRKELMQEGIHACTIARYEESGYIQKIRTGYYEWIGEDGPNEYRMISRIFPEAILCMGSALDVYEYSDRVPRCWHLAVPHNATRSKFRREYPAVKAYFRAPGSLSVGAEKMEYAGCMISIYDRERTIIDCIAYRNRMDREVFVKAIQAYCVDPMRDVTRLMRYARELKMEKPVKELIGIWL